MDKLYNSYGKSMRAGIVRAEGLVVTSVAATDRILIQQKQTVGTATGQYLPREITYANFITGGGTGLASTSVPYINASGDFAADTTNFNYTIGSHLLTVKSASVGFSGSAGTLTIFPATAANGTFVLSAINNASNFTTTLTNAAIGQATVYTLPDPGAATANVVLSAGTQTISATNTFTGTNQINTLHMGASGTAGVITIFPGTAANGTFVLQALNNSNNFAATLTNAAIGQATVYTLPDPGAATANIILSAGTQTIGGVKTFSSVPIGIQEVVQVNLATITGLAGAVTAIFSAPFAGTVTNISAAVNAAFATSNIVITPSIYHSGTPTAITSGAVTITTAGSAAGTTGTSTPSAANTFVVGDMISATITGGTGTCGGVITLLVTRTS